MLVTINPSVNAGNAAILLHPGDNVAIARVSLPAGQAIKTASSDPVITRQPIPAGHKVAISGIEAGAPIFRYGENIGLARNPIQPGEHVHGHNLLFDDHEQQATVAQLESPIPRSTRTFLGYARPDGRCGTRNYIAIGAASNCAAHAVELTAQFFLGRPLPPHIDGVVAFPHGDGCGQSAGRDTEQLRRTIGGVLRHPNVAAAVIVGLGCEVNQIDHYSRNSSNGERAITGLTVQGSGGTRAVVAEACTAITRMMEDSIPDRRVPAPASQLILGLNCGGSDSFSGITANPALGYCCDLLVAEGGTVVLAETTEIFGAQHLLIRRARNQLVADKLQQIISGYRSYLRQFGGSFDENPSPGNKEGGLTNIVEKSLGAVAKSGTTVLNDVVDYAEPIQTPGLVFMNTPGYDPVSLAGLAAGGANILAFTTGRGSAIGFPTVPVLKISSNSGLAARMADNIDVNAGTIADGTQSVAEVGEAIFAALLDVASGRRSKAEQLGHQEFVPWRIGPVL